MTGLLALRWNGQPVSGESIDLSAADRGLTLGDGLFETLPVLNGIPVWLDQHLDRMMAAANRLDIPTDRSVVAGEVAAIVRGHRHGILRITLTRGAAPRGLGSHVAGPSGLLLSLTTWDANFVGATMTAVLAATRRNEGSPASRMKTLSYADNILAAREAAAQGADDALMLSNRGNLAGFSVGNVLLSLGNTLATPPLDDGALPGIVRSRLIEHYGVVERSLTIDDWHRCDGCALTNSLRLVRPVRRHDSIDGVLEGLCKDIAAITGIDPRHAT